MSIDVIDALRTQADKDEEAGTLHSHVVNRHAADEIECLRAEVEHWKQAYNDALAGGDILRAEVERLTELTYVYPPSDGEPGQEWRSVAAAMTNEVAHLRDKVEALRAEAQAERERCAKLVHNIGNDWARNGDMQKKYACDYLESAIMGMEAMK